MIERKGVEGGEELEEEGGIDVVARVEVEVQRATGRVGGCVEYVVSFDEARMCNRKLLELRESEGDRGANVAHNTSVDRTTTKVCGSESQRFSPVWSSERRYALVKLSNEHMSTSSRWMRSSTTFLQRIASSLSTLSTVS